MNINSFFYALKCADITLLVISAICATYVYYDNNKRLKIKPKKKRYSKVLFFNSKNAICRKVCLRRRKACACNEKCSVIKLNYIVNLIDSAENTLDVCVYLITCNDIANAINRAHGRGVYVRCIVDDDMASSTQSKISWFIAAGIPIKSRKTSVLMHHKFCIVDALTPQQQLFTGSLNWTMQGVAGNYEYVTITTHPKTIREYLYEFNLLWEQFEIKK